MKKSRILIVIIMVFCVVIAGLVPLISFYFVDNATINKSFSIESASKGIEVSGSDILLVENVKEIYSKESEAIGRPSDFGSMYKNMEKFAESGSIPKDIALIFSETYEGKTWGNGEVILVKGDHSYSYKCYGVENTIAECVYTVDDETNSILSFVFHKASGENVDYSNDIFFRREEIMKNYITYLGLDILGDWVYNGNRYYSSKAKLYVNTDYNSNIGYFYIGLEG